MKPACDPKILIQLRRDKYWTQEDLAAASGVSTRTIQRIERSGGGSLETWKALAAAFDVDVRTLELDRPSKTWSERRTKFGYMTMGYAITMSVGGSILPWMIIFRHLNEGASLVQVWQFFAFAIGIAVYCLVIITWSWRHLNRMS